MLSTLKQYDLEISNSRIVIPVFNARENILRLLDHLGSLHPALPGACVVVDDASQDGTAEAIRARHPATRVLAGTGSLWWTGGIRMGMDHALQEGAEFIFWLNHDCLPAPGAFETLWPILNDPRVGCVSAWCRIAGHPEHPVNPGFLNFRPLSIDPSLETVPADGLNGNFVGFRAEAVRKIGLPDARRHPHYGDGPYTILFSRAGFQVLASLRARADLDYEAERRLPPFWRVWAGNASAWSWLSYYLGSNRSLFHWKNRWEKAVLYHGWKGPFYYAATECRVTASVLLAALLRPFRSAAGRKEAVIRRFQTRYPAEKLRAEL